VGGGGVLEQPATETVVRVGLEGVGGTSVSQQLIHSDDDQDSSAAAAAVVVCLPDVT